MKGLYIDYKDFNTDFIRTSSEMYKSVEYDNITEFN